MSAADDVRPLIGESMGQARARHRRRIIGAAFDGEQETNRQALVAGYLAGRLPLDALPDDLQVRALQQQLDARIAAAKRNAT